MTIRPATSADIDAILPLWREMMVYHADLEPLYHLSEDAERHASEHLLRSCNATDRLVLVCEDEVIRGYIVASIRPMPPVFSAEPVGFISELFVAADARRKGVGRSLFYAAREWMAGRGVRRIEVRALMANRKSDGFWCSLGFTPYASDYQTSIRGG